MSSLWLDLVVNFVRIIRITFVNFVSSILLKLVYMSHAKANLTNLVEIHPVLHGTARLLNGPKTTQLLKYTLEPTCFGRGPYVSNSSDISNERDRHIKIC